MAEKVEKNEKKLISNEPNNFFNLQSDEEDDDDPTQISQELNQKIKKW